jgi:hypothetical protein
VKEIGCQGIVIYVAQDRTPVATCCEHGSHVAQDRTPVAACCEHGSHVAQDRIPVATCCEHGSELSDSIKYGEFLDNLNDS